MRNCIAHIQCHRTIRSLYRQSGGRKRIKKTMKEENMKRIIADLQREIECERWQVEKTARELADAEAANACLVAALRSHAITQTGGGRRGFFYKCLQCTGEWPTDMPEAHIGNCLATELAALLPTICRVKTRAQKEGYSCLNRP